MKNWLTYLACFVGFVSFGQKLKTDCAEPNILVGQPTSITYTIITKKGDSIDYQPAGDILEARVLTDGSVLTGDIVEFEVLNDFSDTIINTGSKILWEGEYVVTVWDSGSFLLQGPNVYIEDSLFTFPDQEINCGLVAAKQGVPLYDIRENYADIPDKPFNFGEWIAKHWWWVALILIAIIVLIILLTRKKKVEEVVEIKRPMNLKHRTIMAIEALDNEKMWERGKLKEHFVELSYILRSYLTSRYGITLLEKTTYEAKLLLTQKGLNEETVDVIIRLLSMSDMVKFAKSEPEVVAILRQSTLAKQVVAETSPLEFDNVD